MARQRRRTAAAAGLTKSKLLGKLEERDLLDEKERKDAAKRGGKRDEDEVLGDKDFEAAQAVFADTITYDDEDGEPGLAPEDLLKRSAEDVFNEIDADGSGLIEFEEFQEMLPKLGINLSEAKTRRYFNYLDSDKSGALGLDEFKAALYACDPDAGNSIGFTPSANLNPKDAFAMFDEDNSGRISEDEFVDILEYLGIHVSQAKQEKFFKKYDSDKSGYIEYSEFRKIWLQLGDLRGELERRGVRFGKRTPRAVMIRRLEELVDEEEQMEEQALAQAKAWRNWQGEQQEKMRAIANAKKRVRDELAGALDIAGQVYVFGVGAFGQFSADAARPHAAFKNFDLIQDMWNSRVIPEGTRELKYRNSGQPGRNLSKRTKFPRRFAGTGSELLHDQESMYEIDEVNALPGRDELGTQGVMAAATEHLDKSQMRFPDRPRSMLDKLIRGADFGIPDDSGDESSDHDDLESGSKNQEDSEGHHNHGEDDNTNQGNDDDDDGDTDSEEDESEDDDDDPVERARIEAERLMDLEARKYKSPFVRAICSPNTSALWGRRVVDISCGVNIAFARTDQGELLAWGGRDRWWTEVYQPKLLGADTSEKKSKKKKNTKDTRGQLTERSQMMMVMQNKTPWEDIEEPNLDLEETEEEIYKRMRMVTETYYEVWEPSPHAHLRSEHMENIVLPRISFERVSTTLKMRGFEIEGLNKRQMLDVVYDAVRIERNVAGRKLSDKFRATEVELLDLRSDQKKLTTRADIIESTVCSIWRPLLDMYKTQREEKASQRSQVRQIREEQHEKIYAKWRSDLRGPRLNSSRKRLPGPSITTERGGRPVCYTESTSGYAQVSAGAFHVAGISSASGELYTWGDGAFGRLGQGQGPALRSRRDVEANAKRGMSGSVVSAVQAAAVSAEATASRHDASAPTLVEQLAGCELLTVDCGFAHSAAVSRKGNVFVWGGSNNGKLGLGPLPKDSEFYCPYPTRLQMPDQVRVVQISCGNAHTGAVTEDGRLFMWGCADGGRLGLGQRLPKNVEVPALARTLAVAGERIRQVSCGCTHTIACSRTQKRVEGEGINKVKHVVGGRVFVAGPVAALGRARPTFHIVRELMDIPMKQVSAGYSASACVSTEGELYTWGDNKSGAIGQDAERKFVRRPRLVRALYTVPRNLALYRSARQSSVYNKRGPKTAVNGDVSGMGESQCMHTQMDAQPFWEVDLGRICMLEKIVLWNREDKPMDVSAPHDHFTKRLFPCWILVGITPFDGQLVNAYGQCSAKKKLVKNARRSTWRLPPNTSARYVRIQLEATNYLHFAELEVHGTPGLIRPISRVDSVQVSKEAMFVVCKPSVSEADLENAYTRAVRADPANAFVLRQFPSYFRAYDEIRFGEHVRKCPLDRGSIRCEMCVLRHRWADVEYPPGPGGRLRRLESMGQILLDTSPPPLNWQIIKPKIDSAMASLLYTLDTVKGFFSRSSGKLLGRGIALERFNMTLHEADMGKTDYLLRQMQAFKKAEDDEAAEALAAKSAEEQEADATARRASSTERGLRGACEACDMCTSFEPLLLNERICKICTHPFSTHILKDVAASAKKSRRRRKHQEDVSADSSSILDSAKSVSTIEDAESISEGKPSALTGGDAEKDNDKSRLPQHHDKDIDDVSKDDDIHDDEYEEEDDDEEDGDGDEDASLSRRFSRVSFSSLTRSFSRRRSRQVSDALVEAVESRDDAAAAGPAAAAPLLP